MPFILADGRWFRGVKKVGLSFWDNLFKRNASLENLAVEASIFAGHLEGSDSNYLLEIRFSHSNDFPVVVQKLTIGTADGVLLEELDKTFGEDGKKGSGLRLERTHDAYLVSLPVPDHYLGWLKASETFVLVTTTAGNFYWGQVDRKVLETPRPRQRVLSIHPNSALSPT